MLVHRIGERKNRLSQTPQKTENEQEVFQDSMMCFYQDSNVVVISSLLLIQESRYEIRVSQIQYIFDKRIVNFHLEKLISLKSL